MESLLEPRLKNLPAETFFPELAHEKLRLCDLPGFKTVFIRQSGVVEQFIVLTVSLSAEGRRWLNLRTNELGYALMSKEQRTQYQLYCLLGPVLVIKDKRFQVMKVDSPQSLKLAEFQKYTKGLPDFDVSYGAYVPPMQPQLKDFIPKMDPVPPRPESHPKPVWKTAVAPTTAAVLEVGTSEEFPALPSKSKAAASQTKTPGWTRVDTVERTVERTAATVAQEQLTRPSDDISNDTSVMQLPAASLPLPQENVASEWEDVTDPEDDAASFTSTAPSAPSKTSNKPLSWTCDEVGRWLQSLNADYIRLGKRSTDTL